MIARTLTIALAAGFIVGLLVSALQAYRIAPLIHQAELLEGGGEAMQAHGGHNHASHNHGGHGHSSDGVGAESGGAWAPADGFERIFYTVTTNLLAAIGYALLLVGAYTLSGREIGFRRGMIWGFCGFVAFALAPAALLPPEVPGAAAAALDLRQLIWLTIAFSTAVGIAFFAFAKQPGWRAIGLAIIALPLLFEGPTAEGVGSVPPELAAHFAAASLAVAAVFWVALGAVSGHLHKSWSGVERTDESPTPLASM